MATENNFAKILTDLRESRGAKRQEVADQIGISRASLEYYEKGKRKPDVDVILKLADYYGVTCDYLLRGVRSSFAEIHSTTGLSDKSIEILQNICKTRKRGYIKMLNFLIEETEYVSKGYLGYSFDNSALRGMYEYFFYKKPEKKYLVTSDGEMVDVTELDEEKDEDLGFTLSGIDGVCEIGYSDDENEEDYDIGLVYAGDLLESFNFQKLTEQIKESKAKYLKQEGEQHGNRSKKE